MYATKVHQVIEPMTTEVIAGTGAALLGLAWYARRVMTKFIEESTAGARAQAERDIIDRLRDELDRLASQNKTLAHELNVLQISMGTLNGEISALRVENRNLKDEIERLHEEICRLRTGESGGGA